MWVCGEVTVCSKLSGLGEWLVAICVVRCVRWVNAEVAVIVVR